jgi:hypothetical protein
MKGRPLSTRGEKIAWLLAHEDLWRGMPVHYRDVGRSLEHAARLVRLRQMMRAARMYSPSTIDGDVEYGIFQAIQRARKERRGWTWRRRPTS